MKVSTFISSIVLIALFFIGIRVSASENPPLTRDEIQKALDAQGVEIKKAIDAELMAIMSMTDYISKLQEKGLLPKPEELEAKKNES